MTTERITTAATAAPAAATAVATKRVTTKGRVHHVLHLGHVRVHHLKWVVLAVALPFSATVPTGATIIWVHRHDYFFLAQELITSAETDLL